MKKIVCYLRVSTERQGSSGLGLEAQASACTAYAAADKATVLKTFTEVETGKLNTRPQLIQALHLAKVTGATLVIAKLDRLSRNAAFLMTLQDAGVKFVAADLPQANNLTVGIMALVAQQEAEAISKRTKEALQAAKARGKVLGNPNGAAALLRADKGNTAALTVIKAKADNHAANLQPVIDSLKAEGITSLGGIAKALNERGMLTPRGGIWHKTSVSNLMKRMG
ncbi:recombinase family protein [Polaromonas sp.]|uniref:recombinase family protein n=1 Tax=Polaromonas sp. TaxID=1869339 RepID=UPI00180BE70B|nr:recombinase family protein [Polaromonas sp.]NMM06337.1 recombinase family protein [Polaromonas sp.]